MPSTMSILIKKKIFWVLALLIFLAWVGSAIANEVNKSAIALLIAKNEAGKTVRTGSGFVIKPEGAAGSYGFIKMSIDTKPEVLQGHLNRFMKLFKTFVFQETMRGFSKFVEIRTFWYGGKFAYAIGTTDSAIGKERVIKIGEN